MYKKPLMKEDIGNLVLALTLVTEMEYGDTLILTYYGNYVHNILPVASFCQHFSL